MLTIIDKERLDDIVEIMNELSSNYEVFNTEAEDVLDSIIDILNELKKTKRFCIVVK